MTTSTIMPVIHPVEGEMHPASMAHLHTAILDAQRAAEQFGDRAEPQAASILAEFRDLNATHDRQLAELIARHGHPPDDSGSFASLLHAGVARLSDLFGKDDREIVAQMIDGEREVLGAYNHALMHGGPDDVVQLLQHQREELSALIERHDPAVTTAGAHP